MSVFDKKHFLEFREIFHKFTSHLFKRCIFAVRFKLLDSFVKQLCGPEGSGYVNYPLDTSLAVDMYSDGQPTQGTNHHHQQIPNFVISIDEMA